MRSRLQMLWFLVTVGYAVLRIALARRFLSRYGLSIPQFAVIEILSSALFGFASGRLIPRLAHRRNMSEKALRVTLGWGVATVIGFAAPDVFVFATTRRVPIQMLVLLVMFVMGSLSFSSFMIRRRVIAERQEDRFAAPELS
jgi:hypothetical protein